MSSSSVKSFTKWTPSKKVCQKLDVSVSQAGNWKDGCYLPDVENIIINTIGKDVYETIAKKIGFYDGMITISMLRLTIMEYIDYLYDRKRKNMYISDYACQMLKLGKYEDVINMPIQDFNMI